MGKIADTLKRLGQVKIGWVHPDALPHRDPTPEEIAAYLKAHAIAKEGNDQLEKHIQENIPLPRAERNPDPLPAAAISYPHDAGLQAFFKHLFPKEDTMSAFPTPQPASTNPIVQDIQAVVTVFKAFHATGRFSPTDLLAALPQIIELALDIAKVVA